MRSLLATGALLTLLLSTGCTNRITYSKYQPAAFQEDGWYVFDAFRYSGALRNGQPYGPGKLVYTSGVVVEGRFENGILEGDDVSIEVPGRATYRGRADNGTLVEGQVHYPDGRFYRGELAGLQPSGSGIVVLQDGSIITGTIRNGKPEGPGSLYSPTDRTTTFGTFEAGEIDGEVLVRDERTGDEVARVLRDGDDVTESHLDRRARDQVQSTHRAERQRLDRELSRWRATAEEREEEYNRERQLVERETSSMTANCECVRRPDGSASLCLISTPSNYVRESRTYRGRSWSVHVPAGASEARVMASVRRKANRRYFCHMYWDDPANFDEARFERVDQELGRGVEQAQREMERAQQNRQQAQRRQEQERQRLIRERRAAEERSLRARAKNLADSLERHCATRPNDCGCQKPETLRACARPGTVCACGI